jgi:MoxR-like ATPase
MSKNLDSYDRLRKRLEIMIRARYPYVYLVTNEEERVFNVLHDAAKQRDVSCFVFDAYDGWREITDWLVSTRDQIGEEVPEVLVGNDGRIIEAFQEILDYEEENESIFIIPDFHLYLELQDPSPLLIYRRLKWLEPRLREGEKTIVFIAPISEIPAEIENVIHIEEVLPPSIKELQNQFEEIINDISEIKKITNTEIVENISRAALGLTLAQADRLFYEAIVSHNNEPNEWVNTVTAGKKGIIASSGSLEFFSPEDCPVDLGGLENLKNWLKIRRRAFTKEAEEYHLPNPKGVGLIGIPGTGKSLTAKYIAGEWSLPLIRFDIGAVFGSFVGQSEENMRRALRLAEAVAPCVLWIDEIEKAFPKDATSGDSGTSTRVLANFLTWLQENTKPVFVVATANDVKKLPPELLRKGRFDEVFFLDLPSEKEREEIFDVHLRRVKRNPDDFNLKKLSKNSEKFTGAEIEQSIKEALYYAFSDPKNTETSREPTTEDIVNVMKNVVPLAKSRENEIKELREMVDKKEVRNASKVKEKRIKSRATSRPKPDI